MSESGEYDRSIASRGQGAVVRITFERGSVAGIGLQAVQRREGDERKLYSQHAAVAALEIDQERAHRLDHLRCLLDQQVVTVAFELIARVAPRVLRDELSDHGDKLLLGDP